MLDNAFLPAVTAAEPLTMSMMEARSFSDNNQTGKPLPLKVVVRQASNGVGHRSNPPDRIHDPEEWRAADPVGNRAFEASL